ncbi:uncharacterized protein [Lepeophtheirus salmonis]|uniref:uncharacterized protein n=1 Tax=Lepeophtheirus salmonis TaxID=72036 RepID=UPI001AE75BF7|nr:uncharacterized protein LOC121124191 [Lepeophtheirus salmonis]
MKFLIVYFVLLTCTICLGDPETVDGLIEKKRFSSDLNKQIQQKENGGRNLNIPTVPIPFLQLGYIGGKRPIQPRYERIWKTQSLRHTTPLNIINPTTSSTSAPKVLMKSDALTAFEDVNEISTTENIKSGKNVVSEETNVNGVTPKFAALSKKSDVTFEEDKKKGIMGLIIGFAFVAVFVAIALGLVALQSSSIIFRLPSLHNSHDGANDETRRKINHFDDEDLTPPELRGLGSQPSFVQPDVKNKEIGSNDTSPPFFYGKLMLNDSPTDGGETQNGGSNNKSNILSNTVNSVASMFLAAQEAISTPSPSPPAKNDLSSNDLMVIDPMFGGSEGEDDHESQESEEESDDTVYECRGLAPTGDMEVRNPFYLHGQDAFSNKDPSPQNEVGAHHPLQPKPISQCSILHHGIKSFQ